MDATEARRLKGRQRFANIPTPWRLTDFDFAAQPSVDEALVRDLATMRFVEDANALFQVISQRYLKGSIILTTDRGVASWGDIFDDTTVAAAMLDRLLHRSVVFNITGDSYRLRAHQARNKQLTKGANALSSTPHPGWGISMTTPGEFQ